MYLLVPTTLVLMLGAAAGNRRSLEPECTSLFDYNHKLLYKMIKVEEDVKICYNIMEEMKKLKQELETEQNTQLAAALEAFTKTSEDTMRTVKDDSGKLKTDTEEALSTFQLASGKIMGEIKKQHEEQEGEHRDKLAAELEQFAKASEDAMQTMKEDSQKLKADTEGAITALQSTPQKPTNKPAVGFTVKGIKELSSSSPTHATFTTVVSNIGGGYDTATGLFTCAHPGTYYFSASLVKAKSHTSYSSCHIYKNGNQLVYAYTKPYHTGYTAAVNSAYVHLEVGDTVKLAGCSSISSTLYSGHSSFTGFLVTPDVD